MSVMPAAEVAQERVVDVCGTSPTWLCELVLRVTDDDLAARILEVLVGEPVTIAFVLGVAWLVYRLLRGLIARFERRYHDEIARRIERARALGTSGGTRDLQTRRLQRLQAIAGAARSAIGLVVWVTAALQIASRYVDLRPVLAGAGLVGLVVGFGAQNLIRDLLAGFSMLVEDQYGVGDWIDVDGKVGEVEHVGLRTTRFRDLDGVTWHVANGSITHVGNITQRWARATLEVPVALDTDVSQARRVIQEVADGLAADPAWGADIIARPEIWGVSGWDADGIRILVVIATRPLANWGVNRQLRERLKVAFDAEGIRIPVPQREVGGQSGGDPVRTDSASAVDRGERGAPWQDRAWNTTGRLDTTSAPRPDATHAVVPEPE